MNAMAESQRLFHNLLLKRPAHPHQPSEFYVIAFHGRDSVEEKWHIKANGQVSAWRFIPRKKLAEGAQIDLVIERSDNAITVCEIKYTDQQYAIDKQYAKNLKNKVEVFREKTGTNKQIFLAMICPNGLKSSAYSEEQIDGGVVTLKDLFISVIRAVDRS